MNWQRKLGSRKFWVCVTGIVTSALVLAGAGEEVMIKVAGLIGAVGTAAVYMLAEGYADGNNKE